MANDYFDYQPTQSELNEFKRVNMGYAKPPVQFKKVKATHGSLVLIEGKNETIIKNDLPMALLQHMRTEMITKGGYKKSNLKIKRKNYGNI